MQINLFISFSLLWQIVANLRWTSWQPDHFFLPITNFPETNNFLLFVLILILFSNTLANDSILLLTCLKPCQGCLLGNSFMKSKASLSMKWVSNCEANLSIHFFLESFQMQLSMYLCNQWTCVHFLISLVSFSYGTHNLVALK